ncbi:MAG: hypothetical protein KF709_12535 [Gemmatimonadaceae bacterium]|nr:hypothetical protein [Gemmatimonadaceae bacterium]
MRLPVKAGALLRCAALTIAALASLSSTSRAQTQQDAAGTLISKAIEHENAGRLLDAANAWKEVVASGATLSGMLGLERTYAMMGEEAELLPLLDSLIPITPSEPQLRSVQLRTLLALGRDIDARKAFAAWRDLRPGDVTPYRDYARVLLYNNRTASADSVLREAAGALGNTRSLLLESAQLRAALGRWGEAAEAWRETMRDQAYYESATVFSLQGAPSDYRDAIRRELTVTDAPLGARQALALLELSWGAPRDGWRVLAELPASDTVVAVWRAFAEEAERAQAWAAARDALVAVQGAKPDAAIAKRGATAALRASDATTALRLAQVARQPGAIDEELLGIELDALARLGRATDAERALANSGLNSEGQRRYARTVAWAWIRAGDVPKARAALAGAPLDAEDAVAGWLALFDGDLAGARVALRNGDLSAAEAVNALALLSRTTATRSVTVGRAFLELARADTSKAVAAYLEAAGELAEAAPLLVTMAARLETSRRADARALPLWSKVALEHSSAPEAAEARLEWGRILVRGGDTRGAREQFEELIITYPRSALVPQARRELDALPRA